MYCKTQSNYQPTTATTIHLTRQLIPVRGRKFTAAYPSMLWAESRKDPGQDASLSQGESRQTSADRHINPLITQAQFELRCFHWHP